MDLFKGFRWILRARCGYKIDARVAKAAKMINNSFSFCFHCDNSLFNSLVRTSNNPSVDNRINNIVKGYKSSNNMRINSISNIDILGNKKIFNRYRIYIFLIGGRDYGFSDRINNCPYKKEWECLFKCQTESGTYLNSIKMMYKLFLCGISFCCGSLFCLKVNQLLEISLSAVLKTTQRCFHWIFNCKVFEQDRNTILNYAEDLFLKLALTIEDKSLEISMDSDENYEDNIYYQFSIYLDENYKDNIYYQFSIYMDENYEDNIYYQFSIYMDENYEDNIYY
ncbi:hypothetical protein BCR32DRAFT_298261 [Anaeromyces robustus]|uniref:Uncharacterized protein n=1 Tax=Anaeromyces robustus TaxID=1754192 RepID=A0A1Y1VS17_9FUNG|nr:hypothetical protein BCR32DRAFT_298261 [Anaeromyces robustus]|eukprot:ORX63963.1 hypothetical protein BCR32DRAFT_298261 [Anaeromyces robustus]